MLLFWIVLIVGGALAFWGGRKGMLFMFVSLFNLMIAIYVGILGTPLIVKAAPDLEMGYYAAACLLLMTALIFTLLEGLGWYVFLRGSDILLPNLFDRIGGAVCGFLGGYSLLGLLLLAFCMMPISRQDYAKGVLDAMDRFSRNTSSRICNLAAGLSLECLDGAEEKTIEYLISLADQQSKDEPVTADSPQADPGSLLQMTPLMPAEDIVP